MARKSKPPVGDCTIPPAIPDTALPDLVFKRDLDAEMAIRRYVEWQGKEEVTHAERVTRWVITSPADLYSQELFPSLDYTISFHVGVTARMMSHATPRFVSMVRTLGKPQMVPAGAVAPKRSDVPGWTEPIANCIAQGGSAKHVRGYPKAISTRGWELVNWLTHASNATKADAMLALDATHHAIATFGTATFRHAHGIPDRCPTCGSYQIGRRGTSDDEGVDPFPACRACGWVESRAREGRWPGRP